MQRCHLYIIRRVVSGTNVVIFYLAKHKIVDNDMV